VARAVLLAFAILAGGCSRTPPPPDIVFIVCDTLRADHVGCYGYGRDTTPHLDRLAARASLFESAFSQAPATMPSMWNMLASRYQCPVPTPEEVTTLAEYLRGRGYRTGAFLSQRFLAPQLSRLDPGFETYDAETPLDRHGNATRRADSITDAALRWVDARDGRPSFLWLVYFDPHDPYEPPPSARGLFTGTKAGEEPFSRDRRACGLHRESPAASEENRRFLIDAYDEEIRFADQEIGRLLDGLDSRGLLDAAWIVFTSDHGEELGDNGGRWDHAQLLSNAEIAVPLIIKPPGQLEPRRISAPVQTIDVFPTLVEALEGGNRASELALEGQSLLSLLQGPEEPKSGEKERFAASFWRQQASLVQEGLRLWISPEGEHLLDARTEQPIDDPAAAAKLRALLIEVTSRHKLSREYYLETLRQLESLGYL
jgi:arylsulfatase